YFSPYLLNCSWWETLVYGVPHGLVTCLNSYYAYGISMWLLIHFYLVSKYLGLRLRALSDRVSEWDTSPTGVPTGLTTDQKVWAMVREAEAVCHETDSYNSTYWSKYLATVWSVLGSVTVLSLYVILFVSMDMFTKLMVGFAIIFAVNLFALNVWIASGVNTSAKRLSKCLAGFCCRITRHRGVTYKCICLKIKPTIHHTFIAMIGANILTLITGLWLTSGALGGEIGVPVLLWQQRPLADTGDLSAGVLATGERASTVHQLDSGAFGDRYLPVGHTIVAFVQNRLSLEQFTADDRPESRLPAVRRLFTDVAIAPVYHL
ncbi:unnamed protein product, partial [Medioppia subpectinata]